MFKWFRERRRDIKFTACFEKEATVRFNDGLISPGAYKKCQRAANSPEVMRAARLQLSATDGRLGGIADWDWEAIAKWFKEYFVPAIRTILPLIIMLLAVNPSEDE